MWMLPLHLLLCVHVHCVFGGVVDGNQRKTQSETVGGRGVKTRGDDLVGPSLSCVVD